VWLKQQNKCTSGVNNVTGCSLQPDYDIFNSSLNFISAEALQAVCILDYLQNVCEYELSRTKTTEIDDVVYVNNVI
jgi:hypothetical protein